jgi:hypothetical protein
MVPDKTQESGLNGLVDDYWRYQWEVAMKRGDEYLAQRDRLAAALRTASDLLYCNDWESGPNHCADCVAKGDAEELLREVASDER